MTPPRQLVLPLPERVSLERDDYFVSASNRPALEAVEAWPSWTGGMLAVIGPDGAGKSHLAGLHARRSGAVRWPAVGPHLVVEDADRVAGDRAAEEGLFHAFNRAAAEGGTFLFTARLPVAGWPVGLADLRTRLNTVVAAALPPPDGVPLELMGPLGCGVQTGAGGIMRSLACEKGSTLLVLGGGAVGLSAVMGAVIQGCATIIVAEPHEARRKLALELGATHVIDPAASPDLAAAVRAIVPIGVDYAFDTTGIPPVLQATMQALGPHGVFGIVGIAPPGTPLPGDLMTAVTFGHTVKGIIEGDSDPDVFIPELIEHYRQGRLPFDRLIRTYPLAEINQAIADQHHGDCVKVVLLTGA